MHSRLSPISKQKTEHTLMTTEELHEELRAFECKIVSMVDKEITALEGRIRGDVGDCDKRITTFDERLRDTAKLVENTTKNVDRLVTSICGDVLYGVKGLSGEMNDAKAELLTLKKSCEECRSNLRTTYAKAEGGGKVVYWVIGGIVIFIGWIIALAPIFHK